MQNQVQEAVQGLQESINNYVQQERAKPFDPVKFAAAVAVNDQILEECAAEAREKLPGAKTPDAKLLKEMQKYADQVRKRRPLANQAQIQQAVCARFGVVIVNDDEIPAAAPGAAPVSVIQKPSGLVGPDGQPISSK